MYAVPIFAMLLIFGAPIAAWMVSRVLAHQERMEMLRRGFVPPPVPPDARSMRQAMRDNWQPGAPMPGMPFNPYDPSYYAQRQLRRGIQVAFIGLALLIGLSFIGYRDNGHYQYGPWLLGGLVPMFVGIAQIINAVLSGAKIGIAGSGASAGFGPAQSAASPPPPPPNAPTGNVPPGPYGWRPGPTPEIEKPASPPDYR